MGPRRGEMRPVNDDLKGVVTGADWRSKCGIRAKEVIEQRIDRGDRGRQVNLKVQNLP